MDHSKDSESVNVVVGVRVRPMNSRELVAAEGSPHAVCVLASSESRSITVIHPTDANRNRTFAFDCVYNSADPNAKDYASQKDIFDTMGAPALEHAFKGYNTCIFAYGQTGSGKTFTMMGNNTPNNGSGPSLSNAVTDDNARGLIPRVFESMFQRIEEAQTATLSFRVNMSYYEIYNERPSCLLSPDPSVLYRVREHPLFGPYVENITVHQIRSADEAIQLIRRANHNRHTAQTKLNDVSSRSHAVCTLMISSSSFTRDSADVFVTSSRMNLIDLAGSERSRAAGTSGMRLVEGSNINKSLLTLGNVIEALAAASSGPSGAGSPLYSSPSSSFASPRTTERFVPYRNSTLTWLLKDALGGNSRTHMLSMVSPSVQHLDETLNTLKYADRAKKITNLATVNMDSKRKILIHLRAEIANLKNQLQQYKESQRMEQSMLEEYVLRLHREDPFLYQIEPSVAPMEPFVHFLAKGCTVLKATVASVTAADESTLTVAPNASSVANLSQTPSSSNVANQEHSILLHMRACHVVPGHCVIQRNQGSVTITYHEGPSSLQGAAATLSHMGVTTLSRLPSSAPSGSSKIEVDGKELIPNQSVSLKTGAVLRLGGYVQLKYINVLDPHETQIAQAYENNKMRLEISEKISEAFDGYALDLRQLAKGESSALRQEGNEDGEKKIHRWDDGTYTVMTWVADSSEWRVVEAENVEAALADIIAKETYEKELSSRIASIFDEMHSGESNTAPRPKLPTPQELLTRPNLKHAPTTASSSAGAQVEGRDDKSDPVVTYDPATGRYAVYEPYDGRWKRSVGLSAELFLVALTKEDEAEETARAQVQAMGAASPTSQATTSRNHTAKDSSSSAIQSSDGKSVSAQSRTTLGKKKDHTLTKVLNQQQGVLSNKNHNVQNLRLILEHATQHLASQKELAVKRRIDAGRELESLEQSHKARLAELADAIAMDSEDSYRLQENVEAKSIDYMTKQKFVSMVEEARDTAEGNMETLRAQRDVRAQELYDLQLQLSNLKQEREELDRECFDHVHNIQELYLKLKTYKEAPEGSVRSEYHRLTELREKLDAAYQQALDNLDNMSHRYTTYMTCERERQVEIQELQQTVVELTLQHEQLVNMKENAMQEASELEGMIAQLEEELDELEVENRRMREVLQNTVEQAREDERSVVDSRIQQRQSEVQKILSASTGAHSTEYKGLQKEVAMLRNAAVSLQEKLATDDNRASELLREIERKERRIASLREEVATVQKETHMKIQVVTSRKDNDRALFEKEKELRNATTRLQSIEQTLRDRKASEDILRNSITETRGQITHILEEIHSAKKLLPQLEQEALEAKQEVADAKRSWGGSLSSSHSFSFPASGAGDQTIPSRGTSFAERHAAMQAASESGGASATTTRHVDPSRPQSLSTDLIVEAAAETTTPHRNHSLHHHPPVSSTFSGGGITSPPSGRNTQAVSSTLSGPAFSKLLSPTTAGTRSDLASFGTSGYGSDFLGSPSSLSSKKKRTLSFVKKPGQ